MADIKTSKHTVTNTSDGPKVLNSTPPTILQAGASTDGPVEISDAELAIAKEHGWFKLGGHKESETKPAA